jgi:hypothetical protein
LKRKSDAGLTLLGYVDAGTWVWCRLFRPASDRGTAGSRINTTTDSGLLDQHLARNVLDYPMSVILQTNFAGCGVGRRRIHGGREVVKDAFLQVIRWVSSPHCCVHKHSDSQLERSWNVGSETGLRIETGGAGGWHCTSTH